MPFTLNINGIQDFPILLYSYYIKSFVDPLRFVDIRVLANLKWREAGQQNIGEFACRVRNSIGITNSAEISRTPKEILKTVEH